MTADVKAHVAQLLRQALTAVAPEAADAEIVLERPREAAHGDLACSVALQLGRRFKRNPRQLAEAIVAALRALPGFGDGRIEGVEIAGPGFVNLRLSAHAKRAALSRVFGSART